MIRAGSTGTCCKCGAVIAAKTTYINCGSNYAQWWRNGNNNAVAGFTSIVISNRDFVCPFKKSIVGICQHAGSALRRAPDKIVRRYSSIRNRNRSSIRVAVAAYILTEYIYIIACVITNGNTVGSYTNTISHGYHIRRGNGSG